MSDGLIFYSKSGVEADERCRRYRYYSNEYDGKGLSKSETSLELFLGQVMHDGLAGIARGVPIDDICEKMEEEIFHTLNIEGDADATNFANEQAALVAGLLRGFARAVWPTIKQNYEVVLIEAAQVYRHGAEGESRPNGQFAFMSKPDILLRDKEGSLWYLEYKSTSSQKEEWISSWDTAIQLHSGIKAVEQRLGESVTGVIVQGLYKGYVQSGKQSSPFCYGYYKAGEPPFTKEKWSYDYRQGFKKYPIWERPGGVKQWVDEMPLETLIKNFPQTPPIYVNEDQVNTFFRQRAIREGEIAMASKALARPDLPEHMREEILDMSFPQNFGQCTPGWGKPCVFKRLCHGPKGINPIDEGYIIRDNSHRLEYIKLTEVPSESVHPGGQPQPDQGV